MRTTTIGQILINDALPEEYREYGRVMDSKTTNKILSKVAMEHPEQYKDVSFKLQQIAARAQGERGGLSPNIRHVYESPIWAKARQKLRQDLKKIYSDPNLSDEQKSEKMIGTMRTLSHISKEIYDDEVSKNNPLALQIKSGAKGSPGNLNNLVGSPLLFARSSGEAIPIPILNAFGKGLTPSEFWASTYGARKGLVDVKMATRDAGYFCLAAGTKVRMADMSIKRIEALEIGDMVMGVDEKLVPMPVKVTATFSHGIKQCHRTYFRIGTSNNYIYLESTFDHKLYGEVYHTDIEGWDNKVHDPLSGASIGLYPVGVPGMFNAIKLDMLGYVSQDSKLPLAEISKLNLGLSRKSCIRDEVVSLGGYPTYDIEVDNPNHLFVLENGLIVSNSKQLQQANARAVVTADDDPDWAVNETRGLPVDTDDEDNIGALLGRSAGGYPRNTIITATVLRNLKKKGVNRILVRSPLVGGPSDGSLYANDVGLRENGRLPVRGENPGVVGASVISEPLSQGAISCLARGTLVVTVDIQGNYVNKPIEDMQVGDYVLGISDKSNCLLPIRVTNVFNNGIQPVKTYTFANSDTQKKITCTDNHRLLNSDNSLIYLRDAIVDKTSLIFIDITKRLPLTLTDSYTDPLTLIDATSTYNDHTYDLEVETDNSLYLLATGIVTHNSKHCLHEDTLVRMSDFSVKPIKDIHIGDYVMGVNKAGITSPARVSNVFDNGVQDCHEYRFQIGESKQPITVISTDRHKFWANISRYNRVFERTYSARKCIRIGAKYDKYHVEPIHGVYDFEGVSELRALLLGLLLGGGCFTKSVNGVYFSCHDDSLIPQLHAYLYTLGLKITALKHHYGRYRISRLKNTSNRRSITTRLISAERDTINGWLKELELYGCKSYEKFIPDVVKTWDKQSIAALIGGLWAADGCISYSNTPDGRKRRLMLSYSSASRRLISGLKSLLETRFGIQCTAITATDCAGKRTLYSIRISTARSLDIFFNEIPLYGKKREKIKKYMADDSLRPILYTQPYKLIDSKFLGRKRVYDLEIDNRTHMYVLANGLVTHNSAGVAGARAAAAIGGFKAIDRLVQAPKEKSYWAAHAENDGKIDAITPAPQGGYYIYVDGKPVYSRAENPVTVKEGDEVEAGDVLSEGLPNISTIVSHKGLGEGRRYFTNKFLQLMRDSGISANRRNVELIGRGLLNHVELTDEYGPYVAGDIIPYNVIEGAYEAREDSELLPASKASGQYLESPILHYSIGTKIRPSVIKELKEFGLDNKVLVNKQPPIFKPHMVRGAAVASSDPDWLGAMQGSGISRRMQEAVHRGHASNLLGTNVIPGIIADPNFAKPDNKGKIIAPIYSVADIRRKRMEAPSNPFEIEDDED